MILPKETLAAILVEQKKDLVIGNITLPEKLDVGQVLVEYHFSGICGSQIGEIEGVKGPDNWLPHLLGHEASGTVLGIGPGVSRVKPGDKVVGHWRPATGIQSTTPKYLWNGKTVNAGWITTFNKFGVAAENRLTKIDSVERNEELALFGCAITTGFGVIDNNVKLKLGETVVVFGSGGIGLSLIQAANLAGASQIVAIDRFDNRLELAGKIGATSCINSKRKQVWKELEQIFATKGPDVFIDNTGNTDIISQGFNTLSNNGKMILVGVPQHSEMSEIHTLPLHFGKSITGSHGGDCQPEKDIPRYLDLIKMRKLQLGEIITDIKPLKRINDLIDDMISGKSTGRCLVNLNAE
jgi:Zn-dependent alcohol dehydrogenase